MLEYETLIVICHIEISESIIPLLRALNSSKSSWRVLHFFSRQNTKIIRLGDTLINPTRY